MWRSTVSWLLGIDRGEIAEGAGVRLKFTNLWPAWVILLFAVAAIWLVAWLYNREKGTATRGRKVALAVLRCLLIGLVLVDNFTRFPYANPPRPGAWSEPPGTQRGPPLPARVPAE